MDLREAIVIISVFGRGNYLASELVKMGIPVTLLDVSHHMGPWYPEDIEGPFGFFQISESQWERLKSDELTLTQAEGFCLWLKTGPLQFRSLNAQHRFSALGFEHLLAQFIEKENLNKEQLKNLAKLPFEKKWLAHLARYLTQSTESSSSESIKWNEVSSNGINQMIGLRNLFHEFSFRKASNLGVARGLSWCEALGVKVIRDVEIKDLVFDSQTGGINLELKTDRPGVMHAEQVIFALTSEEIEKINSKVNKYLFGSERTYPEWVWMRYRGELTGDESVAAMTQQLPFHFVAIDNEFLPWTHENCVIALRAFESENRENIEYDYWVKVPHHLRFNSQYLENLWHKVARQMEEKIPGLKIELKELPPETRSTFEELGPARHPIYSEAVLRQRVHKFSKGIYFDSPEYWTSLSWEGQFDHQEKLLSNLKNWWRAKEEARLKREAKLTSNRVGGSRDFDKDLES